MQPPGGGESVLPVVKINEGIYTSELLRITLTSATLIARIRIDLVVRVNYSSHSAEFYFTRTYTSYKVSLRVERSL